MNSPAIETHLQEPVTPSLPPRLLIPSVKKPLSA